LINTNGVEEAIGICKEHMNSFPNVTFWKEVSEEEALTFNVLNS
jgi:hypothetical protein